MNNLSRSDLQPLVSIITPAYNCEKYIGECIESVINQTYSNWEMIIVNDKSTDNTKNVIEKYIKKDNRIKIYNQESNLGVSAARNKSIELSNGRFIAFLDSDDMWKADKLEKQINFMIDNDYEFTFTSYEIINNKQNKRANIVKVPKYITYEEYLKNTIIGCLTVILDQKKIGNISVEQGNLEDVLTWMKYLKKGIVAYGLNENLAYYRVLENSVSSNKIKNAKLYYLCLRKAQNLSIVKSIYCQSCYIFNAIKKRIIN